jgi:cyclopropane fatty-acyl-phospholipid synthase-like methyltransferase
MQLLWGDGFLSPGGEAHLAAIVAGLDLAGKRVLDVGCAIGGFDIALARDYGATVVGLDVDAVLVDDGIARVVKSGLEDRVTLQVYEPGRLPVPDASFDVVFGKDSWIHIEDKRSFFADVYRALVPGGILAAGDWLRSDRPYGEEMAHFFELEGLTYHMDTLESYGAILREAGFSDIQLEDIHAEYRAMAHAELERLETDLAETLRDRLGLEWQYHFVENWRAMTKVLDSGDLRPGRLRARKPEA